MARPLRIGLAGLGTVGVGTFELLEKNAELIRERTGYRLEVCAVSARTRGKDRGIGLEGIPWYDNCIEICTDPDIDIVVELIGGEDYNGPAFQLVQRALQSKKHVVTANKALIAHHGAELAVLAEENGVALAYEAAVAGGIPAVKLVREGLAANSFRRVYGILNGTCNYILSTMRDTGRDFADILAEAQALGYAEAEPSLDVDGWDAAHKLAILSSLAFGTKIEFEALSVSGIANVTPQDMAIAAELGYRIKLLGIAERQSNGSIDQAVRCVLVPKTSPIASVEGVYNAVVAEGDFVGTVMVEGAGAGAHATASAVVADLVDLARGNIVSTLGVKADLLQPLQQANRQELKRAVYMHLNVVNRPGVLSKVTHIMGEHDISIASCTQRDAQTGVPVSLIMTTHPACLGRVRDAMEVLDMLDVCTKPCVMMQIEDI